MPHNPNIFNMAIHKRFRLKKYPLILVLMVLMFSSFASLVLAQTEHTREPEKPASDVGSLPDDKTQDDRPKPVDEKIAAMEKLAFDLLNEARQKENREPLIWSDKLAGIARQHSQDMANHAFFSIKPLGDRKLTDLVVEAGVKKWLSVGRLIATNAGAENPVEKTVDRWLSSKERRRYVFENAWSETGIGIVIAENGRFYLTQDFLSKKPD